MRQASYASRNDKLRDETRGAQLEGLVTYQLKGLVACQLEGLVTCLLEGLVFCQLERLVTCRGAQVALLLLGDGAGGQSSQKSGSQKRCV